MASQEELSALNFAYYGDPRITLCTIKKYTNVIELSRIKKDEFSSDKKWYLSLIHI